MIYVSVCLMLIGLGFAAVAGSRLGVFIAALSFTAVLYLLIEGGR